jgi:hypothetical protein
MVDLPKEQAFAMSPLNRIFRQPHVGHPKCPVCNESVTLETCKTDENGKATHEECYVEKICSKTSIVSQEKKKSA